MEAKIFLQGCTMEELVREIASVLQTPKPKEESKFLTIDQICDLLNVTRPTIWNWTKAGKLKSYAIGNRILYNKEEVLQAVKPTN